MNESVDKFSQDHALNQSCNGQKPYKSCVFESSLQSEFHCVFTNFTKIFLLNTNKLFLAHIDRCQIISYTAFYLLLENVGQYTAVNS